jgi:hypothetical protein
MVNLFIVLLFALLIVGLYFGGIWINGYLSVRFAPREEMLFCQKHGPLRADSAIDFLGEKVCSICFHSRLVDAEKARKPV